MDSDRPSSLDTDVRATARTRRRRRRLAVTAGVTLALAVALGLAVYFAIPVLVERGVLAFGPASLQVTVEPADSLIRFGSAEATGTLSIAELEPGSYPVTVQRRGFETLSTTVELHRGQDATLAYELVAQPVDFTLDLRPSAATYTIECSDGTRLTGNGRMAKALPAGPTTVTVSAKDCKPRTHAMFLDHATTIAEWLNPSGQLLDRVAVFDCVQAPKGVAFTPDGREVWVTALVSQPSIAIYDPATGKQLGTVRLGGSGAVEVVFSEDGTRAYASQMQTASVFEIDTKTRKVLRQLKTGSSWTKIVDFSPDGRRLYAANWSDDISEIDLETGKLVRRIPTVDTPRGLWPTADGRRIFVAGFGENSLRGRIAVIDVKTGKSRTIFDRAGSAMRHMVADEKRGVIFTSDLGADCIWVTDMKTLVTRKWVETDRKPNTIDLSADGKVLYVSCRGENNPQSYNLPGPEWGTVLLFDTTTKKPLDAIIGGNQCTALDVSDDGTRLIFSDFLDAKLRSYEIPPYETLRDGGGGRYLAHFDRVVRPGWDGWDGPEPPD